MKVSAEEVRRIALDRDDFGHEMRTLKVIRSFKNLHFEHGGTYVDQVTDKARQFDFRVWAKDDAKCCVRLAVECKNLSAEAPVVVCGRDRLDGEAYHEIFVAETDRLGLTREPKRIAPSRGLYRPGDFVGKSLLKLKPVQPSGGKSLQVAAESDSEIYDRWAQALSSAYDLLWDAVTDKEGVVSGPLRTLIIPIVVVPDGSLWKICYDENGDIRDEPTTTDEGQVYVGHRLGRENETGYKWTYSVSHFHLITLAGLTSFLAKIADNSARGWSEWFI